MCCSASPVRLGPVSFFKKKAPGGPAVLPVSVGAGHETGPVVFPGLPNPRSREVFRRGIAWQNQNSA